MLRTALLLLLAMFATAQTRAGGDLASIDRRIAREPVYRSGRPLYGLVALGPQAETRIWLVLDGETLYVDRNGNGILGEAGEKVEAETPRTPSQKRREFPVGTLIESATVKHRDFKVVRLSPKSGHVLLSLEVAGRGMQNAGVDLDGSLEFAARPSQAPLVHFHGPLHLRLTTKTPLVRSEAGSRLNAWIGTPGLGAGSFANMQNDDIPETAHPRADIRFRSRSGEAKPIEVHVDLDDRC